MNIRWVTIGLIAAALAVGFGGGYYFKFYQISSAQTAAAQEEARVQEQRQRDAQRAEGLVRPYFDEFLVDPASLQLRGVYVHGTSVCGEYNARNRGGGYGGFKRFILSNGHLETLETSDDAPIGYYERRAFERLTELREELWRLRCEETVDVTQPPPPEQPTQEPTDASPT